VTSVIIGEEKENGGEGNCLNNRATNYTAV
jgi:hypothetical protein